MARTTKQDQVRELQRTLYRAAKADPKRRFHALYDKVCRRDVLERAWELVRANRGAAGIDRQTIADVEQYGVARLLDGLERDLRDGSYRTLPARRVFIPKPGRPTEQRPLSIPAVRDRIVQAATKTVIERLSQNCFGGSGRDDGLASGCCSVVWRVLGGPDVAFWWVAVAGWGGWGGWWACLGQE
jgi:retron-type reverse transcriptase